MQETIAALVASIRKHPCGRCDPDGTKHRCDQYSESCLALYTAEATDVYNDYVRPLKLRLNAAESHIKHLETALAKACEHITQPALLAEPHRERASFTPTSATITAEHNRLERLQLALKKAQDRINQAT